MPNACTALRRNKMVLLIGNYPADEQQSMRRFEELMLRELQAANVPVKLVQPEPIVRRFAPRRLRKWAGYIDKLALFPLKLAAAGCTGDVVHICDHSNAVYRRRFRKTPVVVTCHDLLAVRGGLGEETDCPASSTGKLLQRWILRALGQANTLACVSPATAADARRLLPPGNGPAIRIVENALNCPYQPLASNEAWERLSAFPRLAPDRPFVLHVGSNLRRKNREALIRIFAKTRREWDAELVIAGEPLSSTLVAHARAAEIATRIVEIPFPDSELLEALYSVAHALVYPSRFEGFGWPIIEAQACGCPVLCSEAAPMGEIAGEAALRRNVDDEAGFGVDLLTLRDPELRARCRELGLRNVARFEPRRMIEQYIAIYRELGAAA